MADTTRPGPITSRQPFTQSILNPNVPFIIKFANHTLKDFLKSLIKEFSMAVSLTLQLNEIWQKYQQLDSTFIMPHLMY